MLEFEKFISSFRGYMSHAIGAICDGCYEREEIVEGEEAAQPIASFVFPRVTVLHLGLLPRVKWFYWGVHTSEWPKLKDLLVAWWPKVEILASELLSFQYIFGERQVEISLQLPIFLVDDEVSKCLN
jgi:hypothetical protein